MKLPVVIVHSLPQEDREGIKLEITRLITMQANEPHTEAGVDPPPPQPRIAKEDL